MYKRTDTVLFYHRILNYANDMTYRRAISNIVNIYENIINNYTKKQSTFPPTAVNFI